jgi:hypothetical protein
MGWIAGLPSPGQRIGGSDVEAGIETMIEAARLMADIGIPSFSQHRKSNDVIVMEAWIAVVGWTRRTRGGTSILHVCTRVGMIPCARGSSNGTDHLSRCEVRCVWNRWINAVVNNDLPSPIRPPADTTYEIVGTCSGIGASRVCHGGRFVWARGGS